MGKTIAIDIEANTASFINGMEKGGDAVHRLGKRAEESGGLVEKFSEGLGIGTGVEAFHTGMELLEKGFEEIKAGFEEVGEIASNALKLGIAADEMSRFQHAANATHTDVGALSAGMDHLNRTVGEIASGDKGAEKASAALAKLGLDANKLKDQSPAETFKQVSEALSHVSSTYERSAIAQELFGKGCRELVPLMSNLNALLKESDDIGFTRTVDQVEQVEQAEHKLANATDAVKAIFMDLANDPWAAKLIDQIEKAAVVFRHFLAEGVGGHNIEINDANDQLNHLAELRDQLKDSHKESDVANGSGDLDKKIEAMQKLSDMQREYADRDAKLRRDQQDLKAAGLNDIVIPKDVVDEQEHLAETYKRVLDHLKGMKTAADAAGKAQVAAAESARAAAEKMHDEAVKHNESNAKSVSEELARLKKELEEKKFGKQVAGAEDFVAKGGNLAEYKKLTDELAKVEEKEKAVAKAHSLWESARTPIQKYQDELKELNELMAKGVLTKEQYNQIAAKDKTDFEKGGQDTGKDKETRSAALIERKFDFRMPGTSKDDPQKQVAELAKKQDQRADQWHTWFNKIYDYVNTAGSTQDVVFDDPG